MPNDDLGTFPMPNQQPATPAVDPGSSSQPSSPAPADSPLPPSPITSEPQSAEESPAVAPDPSIIEPQFEPTPDEIPSIQSSESPVNFSQTSVDISKEEEKISQANEDLIEKQSAPAVSSPEPVSQTPQPDLPKPAEEVPAVAPKSRSSAAPVIIIALLLVSGVALAAAVYLSQQTNKLKSQLSELSSTLEKQQTTLTPTASPTVFEIPTPTTTPLASPSAIATPTATPTFSLTNKLQPLANASSALKIAINHSPNAQLILIKVDNASDPDNAVTKYFFREDLSTKKYFYVSITGTGTPEVIDKQIYVTPDDNIPSLNEDVLGNKTGIELDAALKLAYSQCANQTLCTTSSAKAQYIKTGTGIIWQISLYTQGVTSSPRIVQINANTQAILYKSPELANK